MSLPHISYALPASVAVEDGRAVGEAERTAAKDEHSAAAGLLDPIEIATKIELPHRFEAQVDKAARRRHCRWQVVDLAVSSPRPAYL